MIFRRNAQPFPFPQRIKLMSITHPLVCLSRKLQLVCSARTIDLKFMLHLRQIIHSIVLILDRAQLAPSTRQGRHYERCSLHLSCFVFLTLIDRTEVNWRIVRHLVHWSLHIIELIVCLLAPKQTIQLVVVVVSICNCVVSTLWNWTRPIKQNKMKRMQNLHTSTAHLSLFLVTNKTTTTTELATMMKFVIFVNTYQDLEFLSLPR